MQQAVLTLAGVVTGGSFDNECEAHFSNVEIHKSPLTIDMREVEFVHLPALFSMVSLIVVRQKNGLETQFRLPSSRKVRDFLRLTQFPKTVSVVTQKPFVDFVHKDDHVWFRGLGGDQGTGTYPDALPISELRMPLFSWYPPKIKDEQDSRFEVNEFYFGVMDEQDRIWSEGPPATVLKNLFREPSYVVSHIVYEALSNAFRHPDSKVIVFASDMQIPADSPEQRDPKAKSVPGTFTLCYWDDGKSIYETLHDGHSDTVTVERHKNLKVRLHCKIGEGQQTRKTIVTNERKRTYSDKLEIFAAAFLPGTTRDKSGTGAKPHSRNELFDQEATLPGFGLYNLINAACLILDNKEMKSKVAVRSGRYFGSISAKETNRHRASREQDFNLSLKELCSSNEYFRGNLVSVSMPVNVPKMLLKAPGNWTRLAS